MGHPLMAKELRRTAGRHIARPHDAACGPLEPVEQDSGGTASEVRYPLRVAWASMSSKYTSSSFFMWSARIASSW